MRTVRDMLKIKGFQVYTIRPEATVFEALQLMADRNVGSVLVMEGEQLLGVLSERDYARKIDLECREARETPVAEIMTSRVLYVRPDETADDCMALMTEKRVRHLPVIEEERVIGVISIGDVVKNVISEKEFIIEQLENYITGTPYRPPVTMER